jgi:hypothetical protein
MTYWLAEEAETPLKEVQVTIRLMEEQVTIP